ncbi:MAG: hypothetical protein RIR39_1321, partial [Pseudomonadota bacterium]
VTTESNEKIEPENLQFKSTQDVWLHLHKGLFVRKKHSNKLFMIYGRQLVSKGDTHLSFDWAIDEAESFINFADFEKYGAE